MNNFFQIVIGGLPVVFIGTLISVFNKKKRLPWIITSLIFFVIFVFCIVNIPKLINGYILPTQVISSHKTASSVKVEDAVQIAYKIANLGEYSLAIDFLTSVRSSMLYNDEFALCNARLLTLQGNEASAAALYQKSELLPEDDLDIKDFIRDNSDLNMLASAIIIAHQVYSEFLLTDTFNDDEVAIALKQINNPDIDQAIFSIPFISESKLRLQVLSGDYQNIVADLSGNSDLNRLIIASELLIKDLVRASDFSEDFISEAVVERFKIIRDKIEAAYNSYWLDEPTNERNTIKAAIASYNNLINNPVISKLETTIRTFSDSSFSTDISKLYLQIAKMKSYMGDELSTIDYILKAIETAGGSTDSAYAVPMLEIIGIITDKDSPERLKHVAYFVNEVLSNSLPIKLRTEVTRTTDTTVPDFDDPDKPVSLPPPLTLDPTPKPDHDVVLPPPPARLEEDITFDEVFTQTFIDTANTLRARVNIVNINVDKFSEITATVTLAGNIIGTADMVADMLEVYDCNVRIENFTIEKVEFDSVNILLICDTSGSMSAASGNSTRIARLINDVVNFVENKEANENIGLLEFNSGVASRLPIGTDPQVLIDTVMRFRADGRTDISGTLITALDEFSFNRNELNVILLMSDGEDNYLISDVDAFAYIAEPAMRKNIVIYSLGVGSEVDAAYMQMFSDFTGGKYIFAEDGGSADLFSFLRDLAINQYRITYTAVDTLNVLSRSLTVSLKDENFAYDTRFYTLDGSRPERGNEIPDNIVFGDGKAVYGINPRRVHRTDGNIDYRVTLSGEGFVTSDSLSISLRSSIIDGIVFDSGITTVFVDENTYNVTIPGDIFPGSYDVHIHLDGKVGVIPRGFHVIIPGSEKVFEFGPYRFEALSKTIGNDGVITLSGDVVMNGWLNFRGDLRLRQINDDLLSLRDHMGGFVAYDPSTAEGVLANWLADKRINVPILPLGEMSLHNDRFNDPSSDDYTTERSLLPIMNFSQILVSAPSVELYPDRLVFLSNGFELGGIARDINRVLQSRTNVFDFSFETSFGGTVSATKLGIMLDLELNNIGGRQFTATLGRMPLNMSFNGHIKVDTYAGDFSVKLMCKFSQWRLTDEERGFGFEVGWKGMEFDTFKIYADFPVTASISGVNVTFSEFMLGVMDIAGARTPLDWTFTGSTTISLAQLNSYIPGLPSPFGDAALAQMADTTLELKLNQVYLKIFTTLKVLIFEVGYTEIELGMGIKYSNVVLGMNNVDSWGMRAMRSVDLGVNIATITLSARGDTEIALLNKFLGLSYGGRLTARINLWIFNINHDIGGRLTIGIRPQQNGRLQFILAARETGRNRDIFRLTWSGGRGGGYNTEN